MARHSIIEVGRELIAAKAECGHGNWLGWLKDEFGWSEATAKNYMNVARAFGAKSLPGSDLPGTIDAHALYALASPRVPQIVRDEAVERAEAGERITKAEANEMIRKALEADAGRNRDLVQQAEARAAAALREAAEREKAVARQAQDKLDEIRRDAEARADNPCLTISSNMDAEPPPVADTGWTGPC